MINILVMLYTVTNDNKLQKGWDVNSNDDKVTTKS